MQSPDKRNFDAVAATWDEKPERVRLAEEVAAAIVREVPLFPQIQHLITAVAADW